MRLILSTLFLFFLTPPKSFARHDFGAGIVIGDPTGLTAKYVVSKENAADAALSFGNGDNFYLHVSWLWLKQRVFDLDKFPVTWYLGLGPRVIGRDHDHHHDDEHEDDVHLAARVPFGLRMHFNDPRIEIYTEIAPALDVVPEMDFDLDFGIGARFYF